MRVVSLDSRANAAAMKVHKVKKRDLYSEELEPSHSVRYMGKEKSVEAEKSMIRGFDGRTER